MLQMMSQVNKAYRHHALFLLQLHTRNFKAAVRVCRVINRLQNGITLL